MAKKKQVSGDLTASLPKGQVLSATGDFVKFENPGDDFTGFYRGGTLVRTKDGKKKDQKKGDLMGFKCVTEDGEEVVLPASYTVKKAIESIPPAKLKGKVGAKVYVRFMGKKKIGGGRSVNEFAVVLLN